MERSLLTWIFSLSGFSAVYNMDTLRVGAFSSLAVVCVPDLLSRGLPSIVSYLAF